MRSIVLWSPVPLWIFLPVLRALANRRNSAATLCDRPSGGNIGACCPLSDVSHYSCASKLRTGKYRVSSIILRSLSECFLQYDSNGNLFPIPNSRPIEAIDIPRSHHEHLTQVFELESESFVSIHSFLEVRQIFLFLNSLRISQRRALNQFEFGFPEKYCNTWKNQGVFSLDKTKPSPTWARITREEWVAFASVFDDYTSNRRELECSPSEDMPDFSA